MRLTVASLRLSRRFIGPRGVSTSDLMAPSFMQIGTLVIRSVRPRSQSLSLAAPVQPNRNHHRAEQRARNGDLPAVVILATLGQGESGAIAERNPIDGL